jgi:hypothetical protein
LRFVFDNIPDRSNPTPMMKRLVLLTALLLPVTAWAQRTPLSNNSQPVTAAPSIPNRAGTTGTGLPGHRQRIRKPANGTCPWGVGEQRQLLREAKSPPEMTDAETRRCWRVLTQQKI